MTGISRDTFYRYRKLMKDKGEEALQTSNHRKPNLKNRVPEAVERAVIEYALEFPEHGQAQASRELRKKDIVVSPSGVRSIWIRHDLERAFKRRIAMEAKALLETDMRSR